MNSNLETTFATMTVARLAEVSGTPVQAIAAWAFADAPRPTPTKHASTGASKSKASPINGHQHTKATQASQIDVRTPSGRAALDEIVFEVVGGFGQTFTGVEGFPIHGKYTPEQIRNSLKRLVAAKRIESQGQARGTTYRVKQKKAKRA